MGYSLTSNAKEAALNTQKTPNIILEIDGVDYLFALVKDRKTLRFDDDYIFDNPALFFDTKAENKLTYPFLRKEGTTTSISQQLNQDGGTGSTSSMSAAILDKLIDDKRISEILNQNEILGTKANIYLSFAELEHPVDSIRIFSGIISEYNTPAGEVVLKIDNPDQLKRQEIFIEYTSELTADIDSSVTTIPIITQAGFIPRKGKCDSAIRINDEIMTVNLLGGTDTQFSSVSRGAFGTVAASHSAGDEITSVYRLYGNPLEMALALMASSPSVESYYTGEVIGFNEGPDGIIENAVFIDDFNIGENRGVSVGSFVVLDGTIGADGEYQVISLGVTSSNTSYIVIDGAVSDANYQPGITAEFFTAYNTLPDGCGMSDDQIDIKQHQSIQTLVGGSFPDMEFFLTERINAKDFIEKELYFPIGAYYLPRKGRASIGYTSPSLLSSESVVFDSTNIYRPLNIKPRRSISKNFYNVVSYRFNKNIIKDKFLASRITVSEDSFNKIKTGVKTLTVESNGLRNVGDINNFIDLVSVRFLDRYKFAATYFDIETFYGAGYSVEVGDTVILNGKDLNLFDDLTGQRDTFERIMEVVNKSLDITSGKVSLSLLDTSYNINARYTTIGPGSRIESGTTTRLKLIKSQGAGIFEKEYEKWIKYFGQPVQVRDDNFTFQETTTLLGVDPTDENYLLIDALSASPSSDYIIELPPYEESSSFNKNLHASFCPVDSVVVGTDNFTFSVSLPSLYFVGSFIELYKEDYSIVSETVEVVDITGSTITVNKDLGFTPDSSYLIGKIGFSSDNGKYYALF